MTRNCTAAWGASCSRNATLLPRRRNCVSRCVWMRKPKWNNRARASGLSARFATISSTSRSLLYRLTRSFSSSVRTKIPIRSGRPRNGAKCYNACWNGKGKRMSAGGTSLGAVCGLLLFLAILPPGGTESLADLQARFDRETNGVRKAKLIEKLGDAQLEEARRAGKAGDYNAVGMTLEKYRDNVRAAIEALKKQHPDAEKQSNGYRQLQMHVRKGIREVDETLLVSPQGYKPPLQIVRQDLIGMEEELLKMLFPHRPAEQHAATPPAEKQP